MKQKPSTSPALLVVALCALLFSCAQPKPPIPSAQDAVDTWKIMEKQSQGHSPRGQFQLAEPPIVIDRPEQIDDAKRDAEKKLPDTPMSLRMHNADIVAVLQALSRAVGKSFVVSPGVSGVINVNFVERPWGEVFRAILASNGLTYAFDGETIRVMAKADLQGNLDMAAMKRKTQAERMASLAEEPQVTSVAKVRFADAKLLQKTVENSLSKTKEGKAIGSVQVDELTNSLIIQGVEQDLAKIGKLLAKLDAPRAQIKLKAHIVETTKEVARDLGILWGGGYQTMLGNNYQLGAGGAYSITTLGDLTTGTATLGTGSQGALGVRLPATGVTSSSTGSALDLVIGKVGGSYLEAQLQALATDNKLNIISSPSIATMDNQKAYTESGERVPFQTVSGTGTSATYSVSFQDAVLRLEITPHIIDEEFIKLQVLIQKDEVDTTRAVSGNPYIVKKKTETTLIARNGETVVISGLSKLRNSLREAGIPGLMDVPGAGWLGKSQSKADLKDEFMIFITPTVLADWRKGEKQRSFEELDREARAAREKAERMASGGDKEREFTKSGESAVRLKDMPVETMGTKSTAPVQMEKPAYMEDLNVEPTPAQPAPQAPAQAQPAPSSGNSGVTIKQMPTMAVPGPTSQAAPPAEADPVAEPAASQSRALSSAPVTIREPLSAPDSRVGGAADSTLDDDTALLGARPRKPGLGGRR
ncbi:MAG: type IV pilus secretin PilQ [Proteobacteria bacterium]|nr:type IV pilus secretin PilQ [Pseudomonadota bacterium]